MKHTELGAHTSSITLCVPTVACHGLFPHVPATFLHQVPTAVLGLASLLCPLQVHVEGLDGVGYTDSLQGGKPLKQEGPVAFAEEVDRIYINTPESIKVG